MSRPPRSNAFIKEKKRDNPRPVRHADNFIKMMIPVSREGELGADFAFLEPPRIRKSASSSACASVLVRKASVASLHGLNSLKTRSAAQHKLRFIVVYSLPPPELDQDHYLQCLSRRHHLTYRSIPSPPPTNSKPSSIASMQRRLDST